MCLRQVLDFELISTNMIKNKYKKRTSVRPQKEFTNKECINNVHIKLTSCIWTYIMHAEKKEKVCLAPQGQDLSGRKQVAKKVWWELWPKTTCSMIELYDFDILVQKLEWDLLKKNYEQFIQNNWCSVFGAKVISPLPNWRVRVVTW